MPGKRCEICDRPIPAQDFYFTLAKGSVCSDCIVEYGFRIADCEAPSSLSARSLACEPERLLGPARTPAETINQELPRPVDPATWLEPSFG